ncbi:hypothetical protein CDAR_465271 [Caerostris darwini]|uniref:Uncharacterized protein n=1 Tax=Caerostris darwini TaxID=1538125 RepID=A0AAV4SIT2_9ARAC|nr:hypothetical protein CDAR_465271 [Caerostris darwini]
MDSMDQLWIPTSYVKRTCTISMPKLNGGEKCRLSSEKATYCRGVGELLAGFIELPAQSSARATMNFVLRDEAKKSWRGHVPEKWVPYTSSSLWRSQEAEFARDFRRGDPEIEREISSNNSNWN